MNPTNFVTITSRSDYEKQYKSLPQKDNPFNRLYVAKQIALEFFKLIDKSEENFSKEVSGDYHKITLKKKIKHVCPAHLIEMCTNKEIDQWYESQPLDHVPFILELFEEGMKAINLMDNEDGSLIRLLKICTKDASSKMMRHCAYHGIRKIYTND